MNPYLFVVGSARSGNTILRRMLDAHPQLAVVDETYWVWRKFRERNGLTRRGVVTWALIPKLLDHPQFGNMELSEQDLVHLLGDGQAVRYAEFVSSIFDLYASRRGKTLAGDKSPGYVRRIPNLHQLWPRARFVHMIRDPRDVCLSMLEWRSGEQTAGQYGTWADDPVVSTALYWRRSVLMGRDAGSALGPDLYRELRYEDLVSDPSRVLRQLCEFLELPYDDAMTRYHEGEKQVRAGAGSRANRLPLTPGLRDWRTQMDGGQVERVEEAVGDLITALGYERGTTRISAAAQKDVAAVREAFTRNALAIERDFPRDW